MNAIEEISQRTIRVRFQFLCRLEIVARNRCSGQKQTSRHCIWPGPLPTKTSRQKNPAKVPAGQSSRNEIWVQFIRWKLRHPPAFPHIAAVVVKVGVEGIVTNFLGNCANKVVVHQNNFLDFLNPFFQAL